mgnify:CR=1 FL=1
MQLFNELKTLGSRHVKADRKAMEKVPNGMWVECPKCGHPIYHKDFDCYRECPECSYGFRLRAKDRLLWLVDEFEEMDGDLQTKDPLHFPDYEGKLEKGRKNSGINESVLSGLARIGKQRFALGIMDPYFVMGSLGTVAGEKLTRLFETATSRKMPVIVFTASGGARMQEGIFSLMQMAKVSQAVREHGDHGLLYISVLTDPTTGGVTASYAMQGDIILAEPHALVGFAGKRVIEQTMHQKIPDDLQSAETLLKNGFVDAIVKRHDEKKTLEKILRMHERTGE